MYMAKILPEHNKVQQLTVPTRRCRLKPLTRSMPCAKAPAMA